MEKLHPRVRFVWGIGAAVTAAVVALVVAVGTVLGERVAVVDGVSAGIELPLGISVVVFVLGLVHALARFRIWQFEIQEDALYLERGVITRIDTVVPFVRVQHVDTQRGPVERATGLASVVVYTAGSRGADVTIPGLTPDRAQRLQSELRELARESEQQDAV
ncbi:PH domain-containing protein [Halostella sp. PRR32]|uniref:PH domain-containing protein n=1 Tax=Halostella sp. PRR32 TaxID=3098147 RepID=UPI002B1D36BD|nr:PH domain-containing protein [Halostella sp. PRR32]